MQHGSFQVVGGKTNINRQALKSPIALLGSDSTVGNGAKNMACLRRRLVRSGERIHKALSPIDSSHQSILKTNGKKNRL